MSCSQPPPCVIASSNHALHLTQQHTLVTFNVAASLARIADAQWSRTCESMRRVSPTIGPLGEWRSLCEGAWTGPLPDDLPDSETQAAAVSEWGQTGTSVRRSLPVPPVTSHSPSSVSVSAASLLDPPRSPFTTANQNQNQGSVNSITTLSAFPFPPTHFPVPQAMSEAELQRQQIQLQSLHAVHSRAGSPDPSQSHGFAPPAPISTDSPKQTTAADLPGSLVLHTSGSSSSQMSASSQDTREPPGIDSSSHKNLVKPAASRGDPKKPRPPSLITRVPPPSDNITRPISPFKRAERSSAENEFGVHTDNASSAFKSHSVDAAKKTLERTDSVHSAGNNFAALRNRYTRTVGSFLIYRSPFTHSHSLSFSIKVETPSQGPKDLPRLQMSVSEIASRYQSTDEPISPRRTASPTVDRFTSDTLVRTRELPIDENEVRRRKQRIEELAELELKEKEYELRQRERELNHRAREIERDRHQFLHSRPEPANATDAPKGPRNSPFQHKRGSQSVTHVNLFSMSSVPPRPSTSHSPTRSQPLPTKDHAPFCGCDTCSVSKYKASDVPPSPRDLRPPEPPILLRPEKPKGWIRRLSMPSVNAAFSLDAKKNASAISLKAGLSFPAENGRLRKRSYEQGISNRTVTGIGR